MATVTVPENAERHLVVLATPPAAHRAVPRRQFTPMGWRLIRPSKVKERQDTPPHSEVGTRLPGGQYAMLG